MSITTEIQQYQDEAREGWMPEKQPVPDYGEPWEYTSFRNCIRDRHNVLRQIEDDLRDRSRVCVNACQGMADPAKEIQAMREAIKEACEALADLDERWEETPEWHNMAEHNSAWCGKIFTNVRQCKKSHAALAKLQPFLP